MPLVLRDLYDAVQPSLTRSLVSTPMAAALRETFDVLPAAADTFGFELRLGGNDDRTDLGVAFSTAKGGTRALAVPADQSGLARAIRLDERWLRLHEFARRWAVDPEWQIRVPFLFLEFDCDGVRTPVPVPSVFLGLDWPTAEISAEARWPARTGDAACAPGLRSAQEMLAVLRRSPLSPAVERLLARCFALVPDGAMILHMAVMLGRTGEGVRLSVYASRREVVPYLEELGWNGGRLLQSIFAELQDVADFGHGWGPVQVDVDVAETLGSGIGLTLQPRDSSWSALLDRLVASRLCEAGRRDALLAWPGTEIVSIGGETRHLTRHIAHAKLSCGEGVSIKAKAYVGVHWGERGLA